MIYSKCKHGKDEWFHEIRLMREALLKRGNSQANFDLTIHTLDDRMQIRDISIMEIAEVILKGEIVGGWEMMQYPGFRNPDPLRTIVGKTSNGKLITVGVAVDFMKYSYFKVTTVYEGVKKELRKEMENVMPDVYEEFYGVETTI